MKFLLKNKKVFCIFLLILLTGFLLSVEFASAQEIKDIDPSQAERYLCLDQSKVESLIRSLIGVFSREWERLQCSSEYSLPEKKAVPMIMRGVTRTQALNYLLINAPLESSVKIIKEALSLAELFGTQGVSKAIEKIEKQTVQMAVDYGMQALFADEIKVTPGAIELKYISKYGNSEKAIVQYIMIYRSLNNNRGEVIVKFYSPNLIISPENRGSIGGNWGYYDELINDLPPFVVQVRGSVENYQWQGEPSVDISFPESVPDFGIKPLGFWDRYVKNPIENKIKEAGKTINKLTGSLFSTEEENKSILQKVLDLEETVKDKIKNGFDKIKSIFSNSDSLKAEVGETNLPFMQKSSDAQEKVDSVEETEMFAKEADREEKTPNSQIIEEEQGEQENFEQANDSESKALRLFERIGRIGRSSGIKSDKVDTETGSEQENQDSVEQAKKLEQTEPEQTELEQAEGNAFKILISEICVGLDEAQNEFIELYNPNSFEINLNNANFSLRLVDSNNNVTKKQIQWKRAIIPPKGYFLLVGGKLVIDGVELSSDANFSNQLTSVSGVIIESGSEDIFDKASWGKSDKPSPSSALEGNGVIIENGLKTGQSLRRKVNANVLIDTDNNANDFVLSDLPQPVNSLGQSKVYSAPEPLINKDSGDGGSESSSVMVASMNTNELNNFNNNNIQVNANTPELLPVEVPTKTEEPKLGPEFYALVINEIMYDLKGGDQDREWIEILNMSDKKVDVSSWKLCEQDTNHSLKIIQGGSALDPGAYAVIVANQTEFLNDNAGYAGILFDSSFSLNNTGESVSLKNGSFIIDELEYNSEWGARGDNNSLQKINPERASNDPENWQPALPTPGAKNCFQTNNQTEQIQTEQTLGEEQEEIKQEQAQGQTETMPDFSLKVAINEIAWQGTIASSNDEWIELYNNTSEAIDVSDWQIIFSPVTGVQQRIINLEPVLGATTPLINGCDYFLLERSDNETIKDIAADYIYTGALNDNGGVLELRDNNENIIDKVDCSNGWFNEKQAVKASMERIDSQKSGSDPNNWAANNLVAINGKDAQENAINGTPNRENSVSNP
jgi:uncharacterized protein YoxC